MKKYSAAGIMLYVGIEFLLFLTGFGADVFVKYEFIGERTIQLIIALAMIVLPIPYICIGCRFARDRKFTKRDIVVSLLFMPLLGAMLFGLYYAMHGAEFFFSTDYGLGGFLMGAISGFIIVLNGVVLIVSGICVIRFFRWLRRIFKDNFGDRTNGFAESVFHSPDKNQ